MIEKDKFLAYLDEEGMEYNEEDIEKLNGGKYLSCIEFDRNNTDAVLHDLCEERELRYDIADALYDFMLEAIMCGIMEASKNIYHKRDSKSFNY